MTITVLNGPNLNLLGIREPEVYGTDTLADIEARIRAELNGTGIELEFIQSNSEGGLIDAIHTARYERGAAGIVFNPGAYTHTSIAIRDAVSAVAIPVVEVHLSNTHAREPFRQVSMIAGACKGRIEGLGWYGYLLAIRYLMAMAVSPNGTKASPHSP